MQEGQGDVVQALIFPGPLVLALGSWPRKGAFDAACRSLTELQ